MICALKPAFAAAALGSFASIAAAAPIAVWNYIDLDTAVDRYTTLTQPTFGDNFNIGSVTVSTTGTTTGASGTDVDAGSLLVTGDANNGRSVTYGVNLTGFTAPVITFASRRISSGFTSNQFAYSTDGGITFTDFGGAYDVTTATNPWDLKTFNLSAVPALRSNPLAQFRVTFDSGGTGTGNSRIDNFVVSSDVAGNNSVLSAAGDTVEFGTVIVGGQPAAAEVTLTNSGTDATAYLSASDSTDFTATSGSFTGQGTQPLSIALSPTGSLTAGIKSGMITVSNQAASSAGSGAGSNDPNDLIPVTATVLDHSEASFDGSADQDALTIDFGIVSPDTGVLTADFSIFNLESTPDLTAALRLLGVNALVDDDAISTDLAPLAALAADGEAMFTASLDTSGLLPGQILAEFIELTVADQLLPGGTAGAPLSLNIIAQAALPEPSVAGAMGLLLLAARRRRRN